MKSINTSVNCGVRYLNVPRLCRIFLAGFERIFENEEYLNSINVYPIPDRDTGTNLNISFTTTAAVLHFENEVHTGNFLNNIANIALDNASGNAGAILAHFLVGMSEAAQSRQVLNLNAVAGAIASGVDYATSSMQNPEPGTILTVMSEFSKQFSATAAGGSTDFIPAVILNPVSCISPTKRYAPIVQPLVRLFRWCELPSQQFFDYKYLQSYRDNNAVL